MKARLNFEPAAWNVVRADAERAFPNECCGFLFGLEDAQGRHLIEALPVDNAQTGDQRRRFAITERDYLRAERHALASGLQLLGIYHSHPRHPAVPSIHDLRVALPYFSYLIVSVYPEGVHHARSWQLSDSGRFFEEEPLFLQREGAAFSPRLSITNP